MDEANCVLITVTGSDEDGEAISLRTRGSLTIEDDDRWTLLYDETNPADMTTSQNLVHCEGERVTVVRTGTLLTTIVYDLHDTFVGDYITPYGSFQLRVYATEVLVRRDGHSGHIRLVYQISLSNDTTPTEDTALRSLDIQFVPCKRTE